MGHVYTCPTRDFEPHLHQLVQGVPRLTERLSD
jgi:hypothetical protein